MANTYEVGQSVRVKVKFKDEDGVLTDPDVVKINYRIGTGTIVILTNASNPTVVRLSQGLYSTVLDTTDQPGEWRYWGHSSGVGQASGVGLFIVKDNPARPR